MSTTTGNNQCPSCGASVKDGQRFCGSCGAAIPTGITCANCGAPLAATEQFCTRCGLPVAGAAQAAPQSPAPQPAPQYRAAPMPAQKRSALPVVLVIVGGIVLACIAIVVIGLKVGNDALQNALNPAKGTPSQSSQIVSTVKAVPTPRTQTAATAQVDTAGASIVGAEGGLVKSPDGLQIEVPAGAIDPNKSAGQTSVAITVRKSTRKAVLPASIKPVGNVYEIGPSDAVFAVPVRITLPLPAGADAQDVVGLFFFDTQTNQWVSVPSSVDPAAMTVSTQSKHFSAWTTGGGRSEAAKTGGWIQVENSYSNGSWPFPGCKAKPAYFENIVCFTNYTPKKPQELVKPWQNMLIAYSADLYSTAPSKPVLEYWLPVGTYTLQEFKFASEINYDPLYLPCVTYWAGPPPTTFVINPGSIVIFGKSGYPVPANFTQMISPACGLPGSAPIVVTLTPGATAEATAHVTDTGKIEEITSLVDVGVAENGATTPSTFVVKQTWKVTSIMTYHWNYAKGATPGTIGLRAEDGTVYGPWPTTGSPGQGGVPDAAWTATPNLEIPPGKYTVIDSDPATWAQNSGTDGAGMFWLYGIRK